ncbi:hypothetical protein LJB76_02875, partial [Clostridia bacterium OttesenSCG-928-O13]|nr:hypothetical protein [Clostridia bacterium OttesenSCG-928-O13]
MTQFLKKAGSFALALCLCALCCACGASDDSSRSIIMAAPPQNTLESTFEDSSASEAQEAEPVVDEAMSLRTVSTGLSGAYSGNADGCYALATHEDGSADILYFSYADASMTMLDAPEQPTDVFAGHVFHCWGGVTPMAADGMLYLFRLGGSAALTEAYGENGQAAFMCLNEDGTNPTTLTFPAGWTFSMSSAILADDAFFYFIMTETDAEGAETYLLIKAAKDASSYEEVHRYEHGFEYTLEGCWEKGPLVCAATLLPPPSDPDFAAVWDARQFTLLAQGMNTGAQNALFSWNQGVPTTTQDNLFYHWNAEDDSLNFLNADTGDAGVVAQGFAPSGYVQAQLMRTMLDGKLRIQFSTSSHLRDVAIELVSGQAVEYSP